MSKSEFLSVRPCGHDLFELIPKSGIRIDLDLASRALTGAGMTIADSSDLVLTVKGEHDLSIYPNGKVLIFPARTAADAEKAGDALLSLLRGVPGCVTPKK